MRDLIAPIYYEDTLPSNSAEMKECDRRAQETSKRIEEMIIQALMKGYRITFSPKDYMDASSKLFEAPKSPRDPESLPKLKMREAQKILEDSRKSMGEDI